MSHSAVDLMAADAGISLSPAPLCGDSESKKNFRPEWMARAVIISVAGGLAWHTWGHWGDFQIDCGRELYVPAAILKGRLLFRDLYYPYGPLAPYLNALLFSIFGVRLTVLYLFGLALTIGAALATFEIARRFNLGIIGSSVAPLFFLAEAFYPFIRNSIFPYTYAAPLGAFLGLLCLFFLIKHAASGRTHAMSLAVVFASVAILTKAEFGLACLIVIACEITAAYMIRRSPREVFRALALCVAAFAPALAIYGWFVSKVSARSLFLENWALIPGSYFMRSVGKRFMADQGFRFVPAELLEATEYAVLAMAIWWLLASLNAFVIEKLKLTSWRLMAWPLIISMLPLAITCLVFFRRATWGMAVNTHFLARSLWESAQTRLFFTILAEVVFPSGIFLVVLSYLLHAVWRCWKPPDKTYAIPEILLGVYAVLVSFRQMMELEPTLYKCAVFFNGPAFLIFVILVNRVIRWASRQLDIKCRDFVAGSMLAAEAAFVFILFFPRPQVLPARLTTDYGTLYTSYDVAALVPQIVSFMKTHTKNGKDILVLPEPPSLYVFAGMLAPTRWHQLTPGIVSPEGEQGYINELKSNQVRYILIANRSVSEYGVARFIDNGYNHEIYRWIMANYVEAGQFGGLSQKAEPLGQFVMWVYERKDVEAKP